MSESKALMARTVTKERKTERKTSEAGASGSGGGAGPAAENATVSPSDSAYETVRRKIIDGEYHPSQRLIEAQLAQSLGLSRHNVRTALDRLAADGLVKLEPNRGASVATLDLDDAVDILVAREALEAAVTRLAAENVSDEQIQRLGGLIAAMREALSAEEYPDYSATNVRFHHLIHEASGNRTMPELIATLRLRMSRLQLRSILIPGRSERSILEHEAIYQAVAARDPEAAAEAAATHMRSLREAISKAWSLVKL